MFNNFLQKVIRWEKPDWVVVVGDVNATLACSVTAKKEHVKLCHIEGVCEAKMLQCPKKSTAL